MKISDLLGEGWEPEEGPDGETPPASLTSPTPSPGEQVAPQPVGAEPVGAEPVGAEPVGAEPVGAEPVGAEPVGAEPVGSEPAGSEQRSADHPRADRPLTDRLDDWVMPTPPEPSTARAQLADLAAGVATSAAGVGTGATVPPMAEIEPEPAYEPAVTSLGPVVDDLLPGVRPTGVRKRSKRVASRSGSRRRGR